MIYSLGVLEEQDIVKKSLRHPPGFFDYDVFHDSSRTLE